MMKQLIALALFSLSVFYTQAQNQKFNFNSQNSPYTLNEEWVVVGNDTLTGNWAQDTFNCDNGNKSYVFWTSGIETIYYTCLPPTNIPFRMLRGGVSTLSATFMSFRIIDGQVWLLGFDDFDENGSAKLLWSVALQSVRYNATTGKVVGYQNGLRILVSSPIHGIVLNE